MNTHAPTLEQLQAAGGQLWEKNQMRRVYFNNLADIFGLECSYYKTGNISSASVDGEVIANGRANEIAGSLSYGKIWYDLSDSKWHYKIQGNRTYSAEKMAEKIIARLKAKIQPVEETKPRPNLRAIMQCAWQIAREAAARFGGVVREYFAQSLKLAWQQCNS